jgi:hypothetical protein
MQLRFMNELGFFLQQKTLFQQQVAIMRRTKFKAIDCSASWSGHWIIWAALEQVQAKCLPS